MNTEEELFLTKLMGIFQEEALEHLKALTDGLLELEKELPPEKHKEVIETVFREAHSLKGAARSVNQTNIQEICQSLENILSELKHNKRQVTSELLDSLHASVQLIGKTLNPNIERTNKMGIIEPIKSVNTFSLEQKSVRVSLDKLNKLFQETEETLMIKLFFNQQQHDLKELMTHLQENIQPQNHQKCIKLLNKLIKNSDQNSNYIGSLIDTLIENAKKILMQPIGTLYEAIPLMVRDIARQLSKEVRVEILGPETEVDRRVLEELKDPITHLIRNAIDHGIEMPDVRIKVGKPPWGTIKIESSESEGNYVRISISDDGGGIDVKKIKEKSIEKGLVSTQEAELMTDEQAYRLSFYSDISTSPIVTELSGRGLGLGIVLEKVEKLGGHVEIKSSPAGTIFTLSVPLTLATFRGVHITVSNQNFILPTHNVNHVVKIHANDIKRAENKETLIIENKPYSFVHLTELLGLKKEKIDVDASPYLFAIMLKAGEQTIIFGADYVHGEYEILMKGLGAQCIHIKNIMAATMLESGEIIPVLNPIDLIKSAIKSDAIAPRQTRGAKENKKSILLVEDSLTTRLLLKNILTSASYDVKLAVDGMEALEILTNESFDLMMTDVEMPKMNGLLLTEKVRSIEKFKNLPIIICSALGSREDKERGIELGASAYIDKNTFNQQSLISIIEKLI